MSNTLKPGCPHCGHHKSSVVETRPAGFLGSSVRMLKRTRSCAGCGHVWATVEVATADLKALARDVLDAEKIRLTLKSTP